MRKRQALSSAASPRRHEDSENGEHKERPRNIRFSFPFISVKAVSLVIIILMVLFVTLAYRINYNPSQTNKNTMPGYIPKTLPEKFTKVPDGHQRTFWSDGGKISFPMVRALRDHGWQKVNDWKDAQIVYQYSAKSTFFHELKPWQRFGHIPRYSQWNKKDRILDGFKDYQQETGSELYFLPESYRLTVKQDRKQFRKTLAAGGDAHPWVLKKPGTSELVDTVSLTLESCILTLSILQMSIKVKVLK